MEKSVVIFGPYRGGKTMIVEKLREKFKLNRVIDNWNGKGFVSTSGVLILTNLERNKILAKGLQVLSFEEAMEGIK